MPPLFPLFKLHEVDAAMVDAKKRHDNMDPGREIAARMQADGKEHAAAKQEADRLVGELKDAELLQKSIQDKIAKFDKQLYGGTIISPVIEIQHRQGDAQNATCHWLDWVQR